ncbi:MAG: ATP-binding protein, partial [Nanoarchaeota archaeon]|nr:ATP-binding protein [Nanoarchaeota archaeon]
MSELRKNILRKELQHQLELARQLDKKLDPSASVHYMKAATIYKKLAEFSPGYSKIQNDIENTYEKYSQNIQKRDEIVRETQEDLTSLIDALIITNRPDTTWDDIGGLEQAKSEIKEAIILPFIHKKPEFVHSPKSILLYGPPGTGKTMLAKASSNVLGATFFEVKISSILSKYFGESPKLVNLLFQKACEKQPSLLFVDELDSIAISRNTDMNESTRRVLSQLLTEIDGFNTRKEDSVIIIGATNKPWDLDEAVISRFQKRIYVPLPDEISRTSIFNLNLAGVQHDFDLKELSKKAENYSGRDIASLCQEAVMMMINEQ